MSKNHNDVTGDKLISKKTTDLYRDNFGNIFHGKIAKPDEFKDRVKLGVSPSTDVETWVEGSKV